jgi:hypothetical protein
MPNSDTQDGLFNKITKEIRFYKHLADSSEEVLAQSFSGNVETAKAYFLHADALTNNDTNGTQLEYAITADGNGLKFTIAFGTKGTAGIAESDDWADIWATTKDTLTAADKWFKPTTYVANTKELSEGIEGEDVTYTALVKIIDATPHLF